MAMTSRQSKSIPARFNARLNSNNNNKGHKAIPASGVLPTKINPSLSSTNKKSGSSSRSSSDHAVKHTEPPPPYSARDYQEMGNSPRQRRKETNRSTLVSKSHSSDALQHTNYKFPTYTVPESIGSSRSRSREKSYESHRSQSTDRNHRSGSPNLTHSKNDKHYQIGDQKHSQGRPQSIDRNYRSGSPSLKRHSQSREQSGNSQVRRSQSFNHPISSHHSTLTRETSLTTGASHYTSQTEVSRTAQGSTRPASFPVAIESNHQTTQLSLLTSPTTSRTHMSTSQVFPTSDGRSSSDLVGGSKSTETQRNSLYDSEHKKTPTTRNTSSRSSSIRNDEKSMASAVTVVYPEAINQSVTRGISLPDSGGLVGLTNLGNTCFMNSMLQCLGQTVEMVSIFLNMKNNASANQPLVEAYSELMQRLWSVNDSSNRYTTKSLHPRTLKDVFSRKNPQFSGFSQHDSQEFMRFFVSSLHEELKKPHKPKPDVPQKQDPKLWWDWYRKLETSALLDVFVGQLCSCLKCNTCKNESLTFDPFWELSVSLPKRSSTYLTTHSMSYGSSHASSVHLSHCLDIFTKEENLKGDEMPYCDHCKSLQPGVKKLTIQRLPPVLVIHLKRFSGYGLRSKLDTSITIPHTLNVSEYINKSAMVKYDTTGTLYELYAVSNHSGTVYFGHYTAWCKHYPTNKWYSYNDGQVSPLTVQTPSFSSSNAYVLFYRKIKQKIKTTYI